MNVHGRLAGARALKALRHRRGLSLAGMARALLDQADSLKQSRSAFPSVAGVQRSVARWESGKCPVLPGERYQLLLAHVYAQTPAGEIALGRGSDFSELLEALSLLGEGEGRLRELRDTAVRVVSDRGGLLALLAPGARSLLSDALADPSQADEGLNAALDGLVADVNEQVGSVPFVRLQLLLSPAVEVCRRLLDGGVPDPVLPALRVTATSAYTLAGRLAFETRDDVSCRHFYAEATREAGSLEPWRRASVHMSHALTTLYSRPGLEEARQLADAAVREARRGDSRAVRGRAHALQAEIAARGGQQRHAQTALRLAWYDMEANREGDPSPSSFSAEHLRGFEGVCELSGGDPALAHDRFAATAAALTSARDQVQRAITTTDQALALLRLGEPQAAAQLLHECIGRAAATGGRVAALRLRRTRQELKPWRGERFAADLDDHLLDLLGT